MSYNNELWQAMLLRLKHSLQTLAMPPDVQLGLLPDFVSKADELALTFDHWHLCVLSNDEGSLSRQQKLALMAVDKHLDAMTGKEQFWTEEAVKSLPEWEQIRRLARETLELFNWEVTVPPSYSFEYVPGHMDDA
jgi:hypothetical protein